MSRQRFARRWGWLAGLAAVVGCDPRANFRSPPPPPAADSVIVRAGHVEAAPAEALNTNPELLAAHELFRKGDFANAQSAFHTAAEAKKHGPALCEEARFYEAEALYKRDKFPDACDTYNKLLVDFPAGTYREPCCRRMFDIANYWLEDTRAEIAMAKEKKEGKRWFVPPQTLNFETKKPLLDQEGRAVQALDHVHLNDMTGPLADKALFLAGGVKFYREDYREADHYFTQLHEQHPNSPLAPQAAKYAIISKHMSTGGPDYDGRKTAEARILIDSAMRNYPELANGDRGFLERQLTNITMQQGVKDFQTAEFYERTGHPASAYFCYEIVRRRYPGTKLADLSAERMHVLKAKADQEANEPVKVGFWDATAERWDKLWGRKPDDVRKPTPERPAAPTKAMPADLLPTGGR